jgi:UDP-glucose 4-epimerase
VTVERQGPKVVVTGGAGFIGTHTVQLLLQAGRQVMVIDDFRHACGVPVPTQVTLVKADVASGEAKEALVSFRPSAIIHLAAQGGVSRSLRDPAADATNNVVGTVSLLRAAVDVGCQRVVFASSGGAIYGRARRLPSREEDRAQPLSPYGAAKLAGEGYLGMFQRTFGLAFIALRYGNVYGPFQDGTGEAGMVAITCRRLGEGLPPEVTGDGGQTRDFVYVGDVARANLLAISATYQGSVNIGTGTPTSINQVAQILGQASGSLAPPVHVYGRPGEVRSNYLDSAKAEKQLGWTAQVRLGKGLELTWRSFKPAG